MCSLNDVLKVKPYWEEGESYLQAWKFQISNTLKTFWWNVTQKSKIQAMQSGLCQVTNNSYNARRYFKIYQIFKLVHSTKMNTQRKIYVEQSQKKIIWSIRCYAAFLTNGKEIMIYVSMYCNTPVVQRHQNKICNYGAHHVLFLFCQDEVCVPMNTIGWEKWRM